MFPYLRCWLSTANDILAVIIPLAILCLFNLLLFIMIIVGIYRNKKMIQKAENEFEMCKFILGAIFICGMNFFLLAFTYYFFTHIFIWTGLTWLLNRLL